mgnify:CR=1 FL=1
MVFQRYHYVITMTVHTLLELPRQEVRPAHPVFQGFEHVLRGASSQRHGRRFAIRALLDTLGHPVMLSSPDSPIVAVRA